MAGPSRAPTSGENPKRKWDDGSPPLRDRRFLRLLPLITVAFFFQDLKPTDLLRGDVAPGNAEMSRVKLQFKQPLKEAAGVGVAPSVVQIVQFAMCAAVDGELPAAALRAGARRVGAFHRSNHAALSAGDIVGVGAAARAVGTAIA